MTLSRVAMVGAVVVGVVAGAPLAAAQPVPESPAPVPASEPEPAPACVPWETSTVASGFGVLENLAFDGEGRLLLSESPIPGEGAIRTLTPSGEKGTLVADVPSPGGLVVVGDRILFTAGNNVMAGLWNSSNGTVESVNRDGDDRTTVADGLTMPNGLAALDDGDLLVTQAFGREPGLTRIPASDPGSATKVRTDLGSANGLFVSGGDVYVSNTVERDTEIHVLDADDLTADATTLTLPGNGVTNAGDDLTVGADGLVYAAVNGAGKVVRVDPATGETCDIASGLNLVSSVRFGDGDGWDASSLYTTGFDGTVHRLTPPRS